MSTEKVPFREGIEYRYDWEANITTESMESSVLASSTHLRGQLYVVSRLEGSGWLVLYKVISITAPTNPSNFNFQNLKWSGKVDLRDGMGMS